MASRRFYHGDESHSFNLGVNRTGGVIDHAKTTLHQPPKEQLAYQSYVAMSRAIGAPIMTFERWYLRDAGITKGFDGYLRFHGETIADVGRHDIPWGIKPARSHTVRESWDGSWDNAVRAVEDGQ